MGDFCEEEVNFSAGRWEPVSDKEFALLETLPAFHGKVYFAIRRRAGWAKHRWSWSALQKVLTPSNIRGLSKDETEAPNIMKIRRAVARLQAMGMLELVTGDYISFKLPMMKQFHEKADRHSTKKPTGIVGLQLIDFNEDFDMIKDEADKAETGNPTALIKDNNIINKKNKNACTRAHDTYSSLQITGNRGYRSLPTGEGRGQDNPAGNPMSQLTHFFVTRQSIEPRSVVRADVRSMMQQWLNQLTVDEIITAVNNHDEDNCGVGVSPKWYRFAIERAIRDKQFGPGYSRKVEKQCGTALAKPKSCYITPPGDFEADRRNYPHLFK